MDRYPVPVERRHRFEAVIRVIDLIVYAAVFIGGVYALVGTPTMVVAELQGSLWLVLVWSGLLCLGGLVGFLGRLTRFWMMEVPATVLAFFGILIYVVVLGRYAFSSITAAVAALLVIVAMGLVARRWAELQIFATDPDLHDFRSRMAEALRRRTQDFPRRHQ